jgi:3-oxoadipate enol-lactonase
VPLGFDETGDGPPTLVLIHGFPFDRRMWARQLDPNGGLSGIRRVVAPDLRGRGLTPGGGEGWSIDDLADDVAALIRSLGGGPVDLGGLSMGGYIVLALLRSHRELVRSLLLMSTRAGVDPPEARAGRDQTAARALAGGTGALADGMLARLLPPGTSSEIRAAVRRMFDDTPRTTAAADALAMRDRADSTPDLPTIAVPTLVLHGEDDRIIPVEEARAMAAAIPGSHFAAVTGAGHLAPLEKPEIANAAIGAFLRSTG